jgi:hypothetical protein
VSPQATVILALLRATALYLNLMHLLPLIFMEVWIDQIDEPLVDLNSTSAQLATLQTFLI